MLPPWRKLLKSSPHLCLAPFSQAWVSRATEHNQKSDALMVGGGRCRTEVKSLQESGRVRLEGQGEPGKRPKVTQGSILSRNIQPCCRDWRRTTNVGSLFRCKQNCDVLKVCGLSCALLLFLSSSSLPVISRRLPCGPDQGFCLLEGTSTCCWFTTQPKALCSRPPGACAVCLCGISAPSTHS